MKRSWIILSALLFVACGKPKDDGSPSGGVGKPQGGVPSLTELAGTWNSDCKVGGPFGSSTARIEISADGSSKSVGSNYASPNCSGLAEMEIDVTYTLAIAGISDLGASIADVDLVMGFLKVVFKTQSGVDFANGVSFCDRKDWQIGVERDLTGDPCIKPPFVGGQRLYTIGKLVDSHLQVGKRDGANDGSAPEKRHNILDEIIYTKQR